MTNAMIILEQSIKLMEEGKIHGSGVFGVVETEDGEKHEIEFPEEIHTFLVWKQKGFSVKKGEKAVAKFPIWKHVNGKIDEETGEQEEGKMFMKTAAFFTFAQVERKEVKA